MRRLVLGAIFAAMACAPGLAAEIPPATITYNDTEVVQAGLQKFDTRLGILQSATFTVTASKRRFFQVFAASGTTSLDVDWTIDGVYNTYFLANVTSGGSRELFMPLIGSGSAAIALSPVFSPTFGTRATGYFAATITGATSANLDLDTVSAAGGGRFVATGNDLGYYPGGDAIVTGSGPFTFQQLSGSCGGFSTGDDFCGNVNYRVTYTYAPGGVPEPTTWAMLILGFGMVGVMMRHRSATMKASRVRLTYA